MNKYDSWSLSNFDLEINEVKNNDLGRALRSIINQDEGFEEAINQASLELKQEQQDWEQKFPKLIVYGKAMVIKQNKQQNFNKSYLVQKIVNETLWPKVNLNLLKKFLINF